MTRPEQQVLDKFTKFDIEHIYPSRRMKEEPLAGRSYESLGNKSILERRINIRASDYRFQDKASYYLGKRNEHTGTDVQDLRVLAQTYEDFKEGDIMARTQNILNSFLGCLAAYNLLEPDQPQG